jgi:hypothetical protein
MNPVTIGVLILMVVIAVVFVLRRRSRLTKVE